VGDGVTWRAFNTEAEAVEYAVACWVRILRDRAAEGDGTLRDVESGVKVQLVKAWPADLDAIADKIEDPEQLAADLETVPIFGRRDGRLVVDDGWTVRWAEPRLMVDGRWAVECPPFDPDADVDPVWPTLTAL
jgi:hypothetical protein